MSDESIENRETCLKEALALLKGLDRRLPDITSKTAILAAQRKIISALGYRGFRKPETISEHEQPNRRGLHLQGGTGRSPRLYEASGEARSVTSWGTYLGLSRATVRNYLAEGKTMQEIVDAVTAPGWAKYSGRKPKAGHEWNKQTSIRKAYSDQRKKEEEK